MRIKVFTCLAVVPAILMAGMSARAAARNTSDTDWKDPAVFERNRLPMRAAFHTDDGILSLNGVWDFKWYEDIDSRARDFYRKGENIRAVIYNVDNANGNPKIYVSRTSPEFLRCLLQLEIPEIAEGVIRLVDVARIPGDRAKISVATNDPNIDPVGACVGVGGSRINSIVKELHNESIDVIPYSDNTELYIQRALNPARILEINIDNEKRKAEVYLEPDQVSLAIGKGGQNIKLASMLTGYTIDVFRDMNGGQVSDDINLDEFSDEVDQWVIDAIKNLGFATAKDVLKAPRNMLVTKADLEEETVDHLLAVLRKEFKEFENKD